MTDQKSHNAVSRLESALKRIADPAGEGARTFTKVWEDRARLAAKNADARQSAGQSLGPLDGRIVSIKDLFDAAGDVTTSGSKILRDDAPKSIDAPILARLEAAGAILIGRTNMSEFAFSGVGNNLHYDTPGNPADRKCIPGGSSSGAAVSVMDGMADIGIGSDTGGSLRIPAALCGAVGFKPTSGQTPTKGAFPLSPTLDVVGPIARSVAECAFADAVMRGVKPTAMEATDPGKIRFAIARGRLFDGATPEVLKAFEAAMASLRQAGITIEETTLEPELDALAALDGVGMFPAYELAHTLDGLGFTDLSAIDRRIRARIEKSRGMSVNNYARMNEMRRALVEKVDARLKDAPILIAPTVPITAPVIADIQEDCAFDTANLLLLRNTRVANLFDLPAISLPVPVQGLPVGLMLMGRRGHDQALLEAAATLEKALLK